MGNFARGWIRRLERKAHKEMLIIPQVDGSPARFPKSAARDAYANLMERHAKGEDAPPEHPLLAAARHSSDPWWSSSLYADLGGEGWTDPVEDLSE